MPKSVTARPFLRILLGPTASGKEAVAVFCARAYGTDVISVDSMKIYRGLDIGTAKASAACLSEIPHHCVNLIPPTETFSVAEYVAAAGEAIDSVAKRHCKPLLSGGSALYYKGLLQGLFDGPSADPALRQHLKDRAREEGGGVLHQELAAVDPVTAGKVHPNDLRRVIRALEVHALTGKPISAQQLEWQKDVNGAAAGQIDGHASLRYPCSIVGLGWPRETLYARIEKRVDRMLEQGLVDEAREVYQQRAGLSHTPVQAVGYKEFFAYFAGEETLGEAVDRLKKNTRHLAKSQMTWFRKFPCTWIERREGMSTEEVGIRVMTHWDEEAAGVHHKTA